MGYRPGRKLRAPQRDRVSTQVSSWLNFTPASLPNLALWLDAADTATITSSGSPAKVSQWDDKSGNGRNLVQATANQQPTTGANTINNRNVITFASHNLATTSLAISTWFDSVNATDTTMFSVSLPTNASLGILEHGAQGSTTRLSVTCRNYTTGNFYDVGNTGGARVSGADGQVQNVTQMITVRRSGAVINIRNNGIQVLGRTNASGAAGADTASFNVGKNPGAEMQGYYAEIIVFPYALTFPQVSVVENYLRQKWGIA